MRKFWLGFYYYPPEVGNGSGSGSADNTVAPGSDASVTSGSASDALIAAAMASESSTEGTTGTESEAELVAKITGLDIETGAPKPGTEGAAKSDATGQPGTGETGQAPPNRIEAAVRNARAAATAEVEAKFAWAKDLDQETVQTAFGIARAMLTDAPRFLRTLAAQEGFQVIPIGEKPVTKAPALKEFKLPEPSLHSEDGKGAYSSDQVASILTDFEAKLEAKFGGQLKPLLTDREKAQKQAEQDALDSEVNATVTETMAELRAKPFFQVEKDGKKVDSPKIYEYLMAIPEKARKANPVAAMHRAYATYMEKDILPNFGKISEQRVRDENARKAASGDGIRPNAGGGTGDTTPKPIKGVIDLAASMERAFAAASASS